MIMKKSKYSILIDRQRGTALFTSLIILAAVTILALGSLGTSMLQLQMANNEESTMQAFQLSQAAIDEVVDNRESNFIIVGALGDTVCTSNSSNSNCVTDRTISFSTNTIVNSSGSTTATMPWQNLIEIKRTSDEICPPRSKNSSSSCDKIKAANFDIYSASRIYGSQAELHQGFVKLLPATGQSLSRAPDSSVTN